MADQPARYFNRMWERTVASPNPLDGVGWPPLAEEEPEVEIPEPEPVEEEPAEEDGPEPSPADAEPEPEAEPEPTDEEKNAGARLRAFLDNLPDEDLVFQLVRLCRKLKVSDMERVRAREYVIAQLEIGKREFNRQEKNAVEVLNAALARMRKAKQQREKVAAGDLRPQVVAPPEDAPFLGVVAQLDAVLAASTEPEPPMRDVEGVMTVAMERQAEGLHLLTAKGSNAEAEGAEERLPPPKHVLLHRLSEFELATEIERHIDYQDAKDETRSVRLPAVFVKNYRQQALGSPLPVISSIATMPVILPDGVVLSGHYLDRERRILFRVPGELATLLPRREECDEAAVAAAIAFLCDEWLVDVPTDYAGKLKLLALAGTILERSILPERPGFFVTSGRRGNGKTTVITMISVAVTGQRVSASAWSASSEERRKALLAHMGDGVPLIVWDNIPRGTTINCPHIARALTAPSFTDRVLGGTEMRTVPAFTVHAWTGNNIGPRGDNASRTPVVRLETDRPDPENRSFVHVDPIGWTHAQRGRILRAMYTVLLGNPRLTMAEVEPAQTRFKQWWHLAGSALEHAAECHVKCGGEGAVKVSFKEQLLANDAADEQEHATATVLRMLLGERWVNGFTAAEMMAFINLDVGAGKFHEEAGLSSRAEFLPALETASEKQPPRAYSTQTLDRSAQGGGGCADLG